MTVLQVKIEIHLSVRCFSCRLTKEVWEKESSVIHMHLYFAVARAIGYESICMLVDSLSLFAWRVLDLC